MQDVLVIGFGPAGAAAAIAAHDAGARVRILEKGSAGGGNCLYSGGFLCETDSVEHLDALCFGKTPRDVLEAFAAGLRELPGWLEALGGAAPVVDWPPSWPHFPGRVTYRRFAAERPGPGLFALLREHVERRGIEVRYGTPATHLDVERGRVTGANGLRADAVILAAGGFEYDDDLRDAHLALPLAAVGRPGNTGDAVRLAQAAGASLWHMSAFFGWFGFRHPDHVAAFALDVHAPSYIHVDADGRRFADETGWEVHDKLRSLTTYLPRRRNRPRLPGYLVFDERARRAGPLNGIVGTPNDYTWSADNAAELAAGWIVTGTPEELAQRLQAPELPRTLAGYGALPDELGRVDPVPLEPPLYAIETWPAVATASGGPRRDARACVLRPDGTPLGGLYAAGGAGSVWGHLTEHGGGLGDALVFGRIAGRTAVSR